MNRREAMAVGVTGLAVACSPTDPSTQSDFSKDISPDEKRLLLSGYALNVESWYADIPFERRFDKAAQDGFSHVEFWFIDSRKRKASELAKLASDAQVRVAQIVGDCPPLALKSSRAVFEDNCKRAVENAQILDTNIVTLTGHKNVEGVSQSESLKIYQDHMAAIAPIFEDAKICAAIEPFNSYNHPGHFIYGSADAVKIIRDINSPYIKINWDLFHMQRHEGELIGNLKRYADTICYVQIADTPDRAQPGTGDVNYVNVLREVRAGGYTRPIGLELWAQDKNYDQAVMDILKLSQAISSE